MQMNLTEIYISYFKINFEDYHFKYTSSHSHSHSINVYFSEQIKYKTNILAKPKDELKQEYCASKSHTQLKK